jgi:hypothetical protein
VKACTKCGETKTLDEFYVRKNGIHAGRVEACCKDCSRRSFAEYRGLHREKNKAYIKEYYKANADTMKARAVRDKKSRIKRLATSYVIEVLLVRGFKRSQITPDLIAAQRVLIKIKRAVKEIGS